MMKTRTNIWSGFWQLADPKIWTASIVPFVLGQSVAWANGYSLRIDSLLLAACVLILVEIGKNGLNDYFDYQSGADRFVEAIDRTPFSGGKRVIVDGLLTQRDVALISIATLVAAALLSIWIVRAQPMLLWFGIAGSFLAVAYSVPPLRLSYHGLGEVSVAIAFGPIIVIGSYCLQTGRIDLEPVLLSIPIACLIANVLWINEMPDVDADRKASKWNLVARIGRNHAFPVYVALFVVAAASIVMVAIVLSAPVFLIAFIAFLLAPSAIHCVRDNYANSQQLTPAMRKTILIYLLTGLMLCVASLLRSVDWLS